MKGEIVLWENEKQLNTARNEVVSLTFLTTQHSTWTLIPLIIRAYCRIKKSFPLTKFYSLKQYRNDEWKPGTIVKEMPGFELTLSLVPLRKLKEICMVLELNRRRERIADIDVHVFDRQAKQLNKVSRFIL
jgi:hypothetical protein